MSLDSYDIQISERLARIETKLERLDRETQSVQKDLQDIKRNNARLGGIIVALSAVGGFIAWLASYFKGFIMS